MPIVGTLELNMGYSLSAVEANVERYAEAGQTEKAVELLCQLAIASAKKGFFHKSELYRDRIYEIDSMALSSIVAVNEAIEKQKSRLMSPDFRKRWATFFETLSEQEANAFFFSLKKVEIESERTILRQGRPNDRLFLVQEGQLKAVYTDKEKELLLCKLGSGDIFGEDTFFSVNVCTCDIKTLTAVRLSYIKYADLKPLAQEHKSLASNLEKICSMGQPLTNAIRRKGIERRSYKRYTIRSKARFELLETDTAKSLNRSITAELWDISKHGLSFYFHSKNRDAVRNLIGRSLSVKFNLNIDGVNKTIAATGIVQGIGTHPLEEYSIHLELSRPFSDDAMKTISRLST
jgi:CRP-like cAMP-binding protein